MEFSVEFEREKDGRWIAEIPEIPGAIAYGKEQIEALTKAYAIALRVVADQVEDSKEEPPQAINLVRVIA